MPAGRPTEYKAEYAKRAEVMCANGAIDTDLADSFNVSVRTIYAWRNRHPEFNHAIKLSKEVADEKVVDSLFRRATGYSHESVKIFCSKAGIVTEVPYIEHVPPDPASMIFWLKNRRAAEWKDKLAHTGPDGEGPLEIVVKRIGN